MQSENRTGKRQRSSPQKSTTARKKPKVVINYNSLSIEDKRIVNRAAKILRVDIPDLPGAVSNVIRTRRPSGEVPPSYSPRQGEQTMPWPLSAVKSSAQRSNLKSPPPREESRIANKEGNGVVVDESSSSSLCFPDRVFGFAATPGQWAECFGSFAPQSQTLTTETAYTSSCQYAPAPANTNNSVFGIPGFPNQGFNHQNIQKHDQNYQEEALQEFQDFHRDLHFGCDDNATVAEYLSNYPALQPVKLETNQPSIEIQEMRYPRNSYQIGQPSWNQNLNSFSFQAEINHTSELIIAQGEGVEVLGDSGLEDGDSNDAIFHERSGPPRRGPFRNTLDREQTAQTRRDAACLRCRMQRIRCHPDPSNPKGVCLTCQKVSNVKISKLPCLRWKITEIRLFKPGQVPGLEWTQRWPDSRLVDIPTWASNETKIIQTTEGYSSKPLTLEVRRFVPAEGDVLHRHWWVHGGAKKEVLVPAYALSNISAAEQAYKNYINQGGAEFFMGALSKRDMHFWDTYSIAIETSNNRNTSDQDKTLLKRVLRLWIAIRITSRSIRICGEDTLGMPHDILDETSPLHGEIPVPPVMGAQIELILIQGIQMPLRVQVLDLLQKVIVSNKPKSWFTIYLCIFILLHNCALITKYDAGYARKYGFRGRYARPTMVSEWHTGANVLLAYWHYCNKGQQHFASERDAAGFFDAAGLLPHQIEFVKKTSKFVKAHENLFQAVLRDRLYENDNYFVSQLYEADWQPRSTVF